MKVLLDVVRCGEPMGGLDGGKDQVEPTLTVGELEGLVLFVAIAR